MKELWKTEDAQQTDRSNRPVLWKQVGVSAFLALTMLLSSCQSGGKDTVPPVFTGLHDISIYVGDGIAYRQNIVCRDNVDGEIDFTVDSSRVDRFTPGEYPVTYIAEDSSGNRTEEQIRVTVTEQPVSLEAPKRALHRRQKRGL